jgi:23S rRNA (guanosine2251-2'-O)-methyltransferase
MSELIYGRNPVEELLKNASRRIDEIIYSEAAEEGGLDDLLETAYERGIPVESRPEARLNEMTDGKRHQGIVALAPDTGLVDLEEMLSGLPEQGSRRLLILDQVQDPVNVGKMLRSALFFGVNGVIKTTDRTAPISDTVVKTSAGAATRIPIAEVTNLKRALDEIKDRHFWLVGSVLDGDDAMEDVPVERDLAVVVGNEDSGLRRLTREACDYFVSIPGPGAFDSLNVAMAATIMMYDLRLEREPEGADEPPIDG